MQRVLGRMALILVWIPVSFGQSTTQGSLEGVDILEASLTKKSAKLSIGTLEGITPGSRARFYVRDPDSTSNSPRNDFVADGEAIKVHSRYSYWFFTNINDFGAIRGGELLQMAREVAPTRRPLRIRQIHTVMDTDQELDGFLDNQEEGMPHRYIKNLDGYDGGGDLVDTTPSRNHDIEVKKYSKLRAKKTKEWDEEYLAELDVLHPETPALDTATIEKLREKTTEEKFKLATDAQVHKMNNLQTGISGLFYNVEREGPQISPKIDVTDQNIYREFSDKKADIEEVDDETRNLFRREGKSFSASMSSKQLRNFFINSGVATEVKRQKEALQEKSGHEIFFNFSNSINHNTTQQDPDYQNTDYHVSIGYEFHLMRIHRFLKMFSLSLEFEKGVAHHDIGGINGRFEEGSVRTFINWYLYHSPNRLNGFMPLIGMGFRKGNAQVSSDSLSKEYDYQFETFPSFRAGFNYRFKAGDTPEEIVKFGVGLSLFLVRENYRASAVSNLDDNIEAVINNSQFKYMAGINFYF